MWKEPLVLKKKHFFGSKEILIVCLQASIFFPFLLDWVATKEIRAFTQKGNFAGIPRHLFRSQNQNRLMSSADLLKCASCYKTWMTKLVIIKVPLTNMLFLFQFEMSNDWSVAIFISFFFCNFWALLSCWTEAPPFSPSPRNPLNKSPPI